MGRDSSRGNASLTRAGFFEFSGGPSMLDPLPTSAISRSGPAAYQRRTAAELEHGGCSRSVLRTRYQVPQWGLDVYQSNHGGWTAASPARLYLWTSVAPMACLALFGLATWKVWRAKSQFEVVETESIPAIAV
jgi:hypothetical protein